MSAAERLRALGEPTKCVWFFRAEDGMQRYIEIDPTALIEVVEEAITMRSNYQEDMDAWMYAEYDGNKDPRAPQFDLALSALDEALGKSS